MLTAAHNLYDRDTQTLVKEVLFTPGKKGRLEPLGSAKATKVIVHPSWISLQDDEKAKEFDIGLIKLSKSFTQTVGYYGREVLNKKELEQVELNVTGYPGEFKNFMYTMKGKVVDIKRNQISYKVDTTKGQSGSGVWTKVKGKPHCIGVHTYGASKENTATRINSSKFDLITKWIRDTK